MKMLLVVALVVGFVGIASAEQKYNSFEDRWETVPDSSWKTKWNSFEDKWSYQPDDAKTEYNAFENKWQWNSGNNPD